MSAPLIDRLANVQRWHTNQALQHAPQPLHGHASNVVRILLHYWPDTPRDELIGALLHDDGEPLTGDLPAPFKAKCPHIARQMAEIEAAHVLSLWGGHVEWTTNAARLRFADQLEAYVCVCRRAPHEASNHEWCETVVDLSDMAGQLGIYPKFLKDLAVIKFATGVSSSDELSGLEDFA